MLLLLTTSFHTHCVAAYEYDTSDMQPSSPPISPYERRTYNLRRNTRSRGKTNSKHRNLHNQNRRRLPADKEDVDAKDKEKEKEDKKEDDKNDKGGKEGRPTVPPTSAPTISPSVRPTTQPTSTPTSRPTYTPGVPTPFPTTFTESFIGQLQIRFSLFFGGVIDLDAMDENINSTLSAGDIMAGNEIDLVQDVLSTTATTLCSEDTLVLVPVPFTKSYINHCDDLPVSVERPKGYTNRQTVLLLNWVKKEVALDSIQVDDRRLYVDNNDSGEYNVQVNWIEWAITFNVVQAPKTLWLAESKDVDAVTMKMEMSSNQVLNSALSNGEFQEALEEKDRRIMGSSPIGKEFDTFLSDKSEAEEVGDISVSSVMDEGKDSKNPFPPIRIAGIIMMIGTILLLYILFSTARRRNQDENWEVHSTTSEKDKLYADLGTEEGVDRVLTLSTERVNSDGNISGTCSRSMDTT